MYASPGSLAKSRHSLDYCTVHFTLELECAKEKNFMAHHYAYFNGFPTRKKLFPKKFLYLNVKVIIFVVLIGTKKRLLTTII